MRIIEIVKENASKKIVHNLFFLYGAHAARYILPLITLPYLTRILGASNWGLYAFMKAYTLYYAILIEFGFGLTATREVSRRRESNDDLSLILTNVLSAQVFLAFIGIVITLLAIQFIPILTTNTGALWMGMIAALFQGFNLLWFFQGLEEMRTVAILDIFAKIGATILIFVLVQSSNDIWKVFIAYFVANILTFCFSLVIALRRSPFVKISVANIYITITGSWVIFIARLNGVFFSAGNTIILGIWSSPEVVGYFAGAERIGYAVRGLLTPVIQTLYPRINKLMAISKAKAANLIKRELLLLLSFGAILSLLLFHFADEIVFYYLGKDMMGSLPALKILSILSPIIAVNLVLGSHWLLALKKDTLYTLIGVIISLINAFLTLIVVLIKPAWAHIGATLSIVISQGIAAVLLILLVTRKNSRISLKKNVVQE